MCAVDDGEPCTWFGTEERKARKTHRCGECARTIGVGETYAYSTFVMDGQMRSNKACPHCHAARSWLTVHCGGWLTESLLEELDDHFASGYRVDGLPRFTVGVKRRWQRWGGRGLMPVPARLVPAAAPGMQ